MTTENSLETYSQHHPKELDSLTEDQEALNGDTFDEDIECYYGRLTDNSGQDIKAPPVSLSIYINGYYYVYKVERRYEATEEESKQAPEISAGEIGPDL